MGGHTQLGTFYNLDDACRLWKECVERYVDELHLFLEYGEIKFNDEDKVYHLSMRFSK